MNLNILVSVLFFLAALTSILNTVLQAWAHNLNAAVWASRHCG